MHYTAIYKVQLNECTKMGKQYTRRSTHHSLFADISRVLKIIEQNVHSFLSLSLTLSASCLLCNLVLYRVTVWNILEGGVKEHETCKCPLCSVTNHLKYFNILARFKPAILGLFIPVKKIEE